MSDNGYNYIRNGFCRDQSDKSLQPFIHITRQLGMHPPLDSKHFRKGFQALLGYTSSKGDFSLCNNFFYFVFGCIRKILKRCEKYDIFVTSAINASKYDWDKLIDFLHYMHMRENWLSGDTRKIDTSLTFLLNIIKQALINHVLNNNETLSDILVSFLFFWYVPIDSRLILFVKLIYCVLFLT